MPLEKAAGRGHKYLTEAIQWLHAKRYMHPVSYLSKDFSVLNLVNSFSFSSVLSCISSKVSFVGQAIYLPICRFQEKRVFHAQLLWSVGKREQKQLKPLKHYVLLANTKHKNFRQGKFLGKWLSAYKVHGLVAGFRLHYCNVFCQRIHKLLTEGCGFQAVIHVGRKVFTTANNSLQTRRFKSAVLKVRFSLWEKVKVGRSLLVWKDPIRHQRVSGATVVFYWFP